MQSYKCPNNKEEDYDIDYCESMANGEGCDKKDRCQVYQINKNNKKSMDSMDTQHIVSQLKKHKISPPIMDNG